MSLRKEGVGTEVKHAAVVSLEHEDILWRNGVLGVPRILSFEQCFTQSVYTSASEEVKNTMI